MFNIFDIPAAVLVGGGSSNEIGGRSIFDGSEIRKCLGMIAGMMAEATGIGDKRILRVVTIGFVELSEEELYFPELLEVCTLDPISINF